MAEPVLADEWIYKTLSADPEIRTLVGAGPTDAAPRVYQGVAPQDAALPYIIYVDQSSTPTRAHSGAKPIMYQLVYLVRGVGAGESRTGVLENIANRVQTLLETENGGTFAVVPSGRGEVYGAHMETGYSRSEVLSGGGGAVITYLGGTYRIYTTPASPPNLYL